MLANDEAVLSFYRSLYRCFSKTLIMLHTTACSAVDPYFIITFGQNPGPAVIVAETALSDNSRNFTGQG